MQVDSVFVQLSSEQPQELLRFYRDIVGLPPAQGLEEFALNAAGTTIGFDAHSEITGDTREPARVLINLSVANVAAEQNRLESSGVKFIRTQGREPWGGIISTFIDPDGNYCQLIEYHPE